MFGVSVRDKGGLGLGLGIHSSWGYTYHHQGLGYSEKRKANLSSSSSCSLKLRFIRGPFLVEAQSPRIRHGRNENDGSTEFEISWVSTKPGKACTVVKLVLASVDHRVVGELGLVKNASECLHD